MTSKKILVKWILEQFQECGYEDDWQAERFSVIGDVSGARHQHSDLDFFFFWKVYDQQWFAGQSEVIFDKLRRLAGGGPKMVESMAAVPPDYAKRLKSACETESLPLGVQKAFTRVRGGWRVLGWAVKAAKQLHELYAIEETSYIGRWLVKFICNKQWTGNYEDLVHCINGEIEGRIGNLRGNLQMLSDTTRTFLQETLLSSEAHLSGSGLETLSYFFRDWRDIILCKYMWKHDQKNEDFWHLACQILGPSGMGPRGKDIQDVLDFLASCLSREEIESGVLARINTAVYRLMSAHGDMGIKRRLRDLEAETR